MSNPSNAYTGPPASIVAALERARARRSSRRNQE